MILLFYAKEKSKSKKTKSPGKTNNKPKATTPAKGGYTDAT